MVTWFRAARSAAGFGGGLLDMSAWKSCREALYRGATKGRGALIRRSGCLDNYSGQIRLPGLSPLSLRLLVTGRGRLARVANLRQQHVLPARCGVAILTVFLRGRGRCLPFCSCSVSKCKLYYFSIFLLFSLLI